MDFSIFDMSAKFGAGNDFKPLLFSGFQCFVDAIDRIVVGETQGLEAGLASLLYSLGRGA